MFSITNIIIGITAVVSFMAFSNAKLKDDLIFAPTAVTHRNQWYRFFSCALIHLDITHLVFNMFALYSFGNLVESTFLSLFGAKGTFLYILLYVISQFLCLVPTYNNHKEDYYYQSLGASGAVSAVIFAGIVLYPMAGIGMFFIPVSIPGFIFGFIYLGITAFLDRRGGGSMNHSAHLFGAIAGIGLLLIFGFTMSQNNLVTDFIDQIKSFGK